MYNQTDPTTKTPMLLREISLLAPTKMLNRGLDEKELPNMARHWKLLRGRNAHVADDAARMVAPGGTWNWLS